MYSTPCRQPGGLARRGVPPRRQRPGVAAEPLDGGGVRVHYLVSVKPPFDGGRGKEEQGKVQGEECGRRKGRRDAEEREGGPAPPVREDRDGRREREDSGGDAREAEYAFAPFEYGRPRLHPVVELEDPGPSAVEILGPERERDETEGVEESECGEKAHCETASLLARHRRAGLLRTDEHFDEEDQKTHGKQRQKQEARHRIVVVRSRDDA